MPGSHFLSFQVLTEEAAEYAESVGALFAETSAKTAVNVQQLFIEISRFHLALSDIFLISCLFQQARLFPQRLSFPQSLRILEEL